ncbi:osomolarity two-component system, sensor histidine kinase SLN1 [Sporothrix brasiliensis 5110]|uniref:histidine kinase n=1 Tax=Sporothrix brasiliensis 5110 TaxID=1398154 RepID=A0A0C2J826_9PEZI|nr:osomolarity two-component system, sensor histidine kinase SLN1 [Sporothrix brasiliensis 5110]KIH93127.1 osomolarity two-component system, sensor histidine kinase SLN1 [Sporothrix brasiliensis 5110]
MRVAIREQLAALVIIAVMVALAIVSIPTWIFVNHFVGDVESTGLALTASLKAARISSEIDLLQTTCENVASRILIQGAFSSFYAGNHSESNWDLAQQDMQSALGAGGFTTLFQSRLYSRNTSGRATGLLNVTGNGIGSIELPYENGNGSRVYLGDPDLGYPPTLYPNITYNDTGMPSSIDNTTNAFTATAFPDVKLTNNGGLLLGPLIINSSFALVSLTVPIRQNSNTFLLGYMTVVASATSLIDTQTTPEGLGQSGVVLIVGPNTPWNRFNLTDPASNNTYVPEDRDDFGENEVHFILPPIASASGADRHNNYDFKSGSYTDTFKMSKYPSVLDAFAEQTNTVNNATATLSTTNEQGYDVAVGYARPQSTLVTWAVLVEQAHSEAYAPVVTLRKILLGTVFGTAGFVILVVFPCAHLSVKPIRELKDATEKSIAPPGYADDDELPSSGTRSSRSRISDHAWFVRLRTMLGLHRVKTPHPSDGREGGSGHAIFKIPGHVPERKHIITDELTELTTTFNAMTDELYKQYESLDEKVALRTRELEISKKAAEAANESKTLFIANISHELKTPLNGIMGMCAVCMEEDDIVRIKQSLKTLYKSGDLLLHLLEDLLSFSKNQIGHQVSLEEREFRLGDIRSQVLSIFDKQVREGRITFNVSYIGSTDPLDQQGTVPLPPAGAAAAAAAADLGAVVVADNGLTNLPSVAASERTSFDRRLPALGPAGVGRLKDMCLWGDQQRILQVIINLVSNSIKFTPASGAVDLRIRCVGEAEHFEESRSSSFSKSGSHRGGRSRHRIGSSSTHSQSSKNGANGGSGSISTTTGTTLYKGTASGTAIAINPIGPKSTTTGQYRIRERSPTPPPPGSKTFIFEFEVQDTGPGIPQHMQEKVFEPFVQGDLGLSKKFGGTGLGLSICQQLATLMGGTVTLKSTPGIGTIFTMRIPLKYVKDSLKSRPPSVSSADGGDNRRNSFPKQAVDPSAKAKQPPVLDKQARLVGLSQPFFVANPPHTAAATEQSKADQLAALDRAVANKADSQARVRVLVADDNSTNIEVVSRMLKLEDIYDVTIAKDGQEAYDLVKANMEKNQRFDVIFMDVQMPNLDGLQSTRLIRKMGYSAPIVALTAFSEESNVKECMESGMDEFLSKPIRRPALKQVLQKFATIPEEPEPTSSTRRTTPTRTTQTTQTTHAVDVPNNAPKKAPNPAHLDKEGETLNEKADLPAHQPQPQPQPPDLSNSAPTVANGVSTTIATPPETPLEFDRSLGKPPIEKA